MKPRAIAILCAIVGSSAFGAIDLALLEQRNPDFDWPALAKGDVCWQELPDAEVDDAALVGMVAVRLTADMDTVLEQLYRTQPGATNLALDVRSDASVRESLNRFALPRGEHTDLDWFFEPVADGTFNATSEELGILRSAAVQSRERGDTREQNIDAIEEAVRDLLAARVNEYRATGLSAVRPYDIGRKQIHPGDYLANSLRPIRLLREEEPGFYAAFLDYPNVQNSYEQRFFVTTETEPDSNRPLTSLKHWMVKQADGYTLIAERKFYVSHSLDAMHTLILLLERDETSYVFLVNQSFTQKVTGLGSFVAHRIGRRKLKQNVLPLFEALRTSLQ